MRQLSNILFILLLTASVQAAEFAFLFNNGTFAIDSNPLAHPERVARLSSFQIVTQQVAITIAKPAWITQAEQLFSQGMELNGYGTSPWTNQTLESVGVDLLQRSIYGETEEVRNSANRWKSVLESTFTTMLREHNRYRQQYGQAEITAIWDYPLDSEFIYTNQIDRIYIEYLDEQYQPMLGPR
jgi:hypothetical protein